MSICRGSLKACTGADCCSQQEIDMAFWLLSPISQT